MRERKLPLSQPVRLTAPLTRGALGAVSAGATNLRLSNWFALTQNKKHESAIGYCIGTVADFKGPLVIWNGPVKPTGNAEILLR